MKKILSIGEKEISIQIDREIVCEVVDKFSDFFADFYNAAAEISAEKNSMDEQTDSQESVIRTVAEKIKNKQFSLILSLPDKKIEVTRYALPMLIHKANPDLNVIECAEKASEIIDYCFENEAEDVLADVIFDFVNEGFVAGGAERKPKIAVTLN